MSIQEWNKESLQNKIYDLGPWHYCHAFPFGLTTGSYPSEMMPDKMIRLVRYGAFIQPVYKRVLDIGANSGIISMWFVDNKKSVVDAVEAGPIYYPQLELAVEVKGYSDKINPIHGNIISHQIPVNTYNLISFLGTLHHIPEEHWSSILQKCHAGMLPSGEIVVQTKTEIPVIGLLENAGFIHVKQLYTSQEHERSAWYGMKDAMKV